MYYLRAYVRMLLCVCVRAGSPLCTCLSVGMNVVMHSAWAQASVRLSVCLHTLACVHPFLCWVHACIHVCIFKRP